MPVPRTLSENEQHMLLGLCMEMLAVPQMLCRHRACRRRRICGFVVPGTFFPDCISEEWHDDFMRMLGELFVPATDIANGTRLAVPATDATIRELEEAAIEVVRAFCRTLPDLRPGFAAWLAAYRRAQQPAPPPVNVPPALPVPAPVSEARTPPDRPEMVEAAREWDEPEPEIWRTIERVPRPEPRIRIEY